VKVQGNMRKYKKWEIMRKYKKWEIMRKYRESARKSTKWEIMRKYRESERKCYKCWKSMWKYVKECESNQKEI